MDTTSSAVTLAGKPLIGIVAGADLALAAELMNARDVGVLGVYTSDGHDLVGILSERDITRAIAEKRDPWTTRVSYVMSTPPIVVEGPIARDHAAAILRKEHIRHLVVKSEGADRIISIRDLTSEGGER
jgi:CBS domain-containing protein